ncbi:ABC transporter substrate-binding protein [Paenibacillus polymyxa]|uniref:ABC transporter substrate-binding protein n=1 Tax=Paenibacillus polymyxa TaxID=1406 RepID=UPI001F5841BF|nr:ABC transporter substrate-binding protein [Paenibacillus polymyxa]MDU8671313.1 ABC transporter substrate-binding protein [Paenibacillus polymyxa]MDU8696223.1 ABC transporter substrate-binding protein [Paenibacillus polymyxa]MEE4579544.1 ABC transporter substrate-binding protein [Paenibacillus polymyxa]UNL92285.1 ABC transporter substrate-binding protein [Paenibacillus polymyxa]UQQ37629.1 ABC transporter substrate-binding protein [Paenibacillus polymyxa]
MKLFKRAGMLMLAGVFVLSGCSGGGGESKNQTVNPDQDANFNKTGLPIVKEAVTLKMVSPKAALAPDYSKMEIFKRLEKQTNIKIDWGNIPDTDFAEKKNLLLASGDLPDAFYGAGFTDYELINYGKDGTIIPLENLIDKYAPNLKALLDRRPDIKLAITAPDGHIYGLPSWEENKLDTNPFFHVINKNWLDKLGLKVPQTLDEYTQALIAFKTKDPNGNGKADEIPLSFMHMQWCSDIAGIFGAFGLPDNLEHRIVREGKVIFTASQPQFKEALKYIHDNWYKQGLIDPESFTQDAAQYLAKGKTPDETLGSYVWWEVEEVVGPERSKDYALLPPLKGPNGDQMIGRNNGGGPGRGSFVITKENRYPAMTMRWIDQQYDPYMAAQIHWGPLDFVFKKDEKGKLVNLPLPKGVSAGEFRQKVAPGTGNPGVITFDDFGKVVDMEPRAQKRAEYLEKYYTPYMKKENYPSIFFEPDELDKINRIEPELIKYVNTQRGKFIVDGEVDEKWDSYVKTLEKMGLNELMEIYQKGLDRYNANLINK